MPSGRSGGFVIETAALKELLKSVTRCGATRTASMMDEARRLSCLLSIFKAPPRRNGIKDY